MPSVRSSFASFVLGGEPLTSGVDNIERVMPFSPKKRYPMITLDALGGFTEDKLAERDFKRRFLPVISVCILALLCFGVSVIIPLRQKTCDDLPLIYGLLAGVSFVIALGSIFCGWYWMIRTAPISPQSRQPMEIYQLEDTIKEGKCELVYLCRRSHTFFRMVFTAPG
jgi:hypothetical protein